MYKPNPEQLAALESAKAFWGKQWKQELSECWLSSRYPYQLDAQKHLLQQVRNQGGPSFLKTFRFPKSERVWIQVHPFALGGAVKVLDKAPEPTNLEKLEQQINRLKSKAKQGKTLAEKLELQQQVKSLQAQKRQLMIAD
ncbi:MAG TPA: hypothetical protein V6D19_16045, partial [Stenomitos sp.]